MYRFERSYNKFVQIEIEKRREEKRKMFLLPAKFIYHEELRGRDEMKREREREFGKRWWEDKVVRYR